MQGGEPAPIRATPLRVLVALAKRAGRTVSKQELMDEVWPGVAVSDASLATAIRELRLVLGDDGLQQRYIETLRNRGYRLVAHIAEPGPSEERASVTSASDAANPESFDLLCRLGVRLFRTGRHEEARAAYREAAGAARRDGDDARFVEAALGFAGGLAHSASGNARPECIELLEEAASRGHASTLAQRAYVRARLALNTVWTRRDDAHVLVRQAEEMARAAGDDQTLAIVLYDKFMVLWSPDNLEERLEIAADLVDTAERAGDALAAAFGHQLRAAARLESGDRTGAEAASLDAVERLEGRQQVGLDQWVAGSQACMTLLDGRFADTERFAAESLGYGLELGAANAIAIHAGQIGWLRLDQGRGAELAPLIDGFTGPRPLFALGAALMRYEAGDVEAARAEFEAQVDALGEIDRDADWLGCLTLLAELAVRCGDADRAAILHDELMPHQAQCVVIGVRTACRGSVALYAGLLARVAGRREFVVPHLELAVKTNARLRAVPLLARAQLELATTLLERDAGEDRQRAAGLLSECAGLCRGIRLAHMEEKALELGRAHD